MHHRSERHDILPGTQPPLGGLFIDRWGTLLELPEGGDARGPEDLRFLPGAVDSLHRAQRAGWEIYLIGNEDGVAFGRVPPRDWERTEAALLLELESHGVPVRRCYSATTHPRGVAGQRGDSVYRLPNTGSFYHAQHHDGLSLRASWVIGDSTLEHAAAWRAGVRRAAVRTGLALSDKEFEVDVDLVSRDLCEAIESLLRGSWRVAA